MSHSYPLKRFKRGDRVHIRAQQVWLILVYYAVKGVTISYGDLAILMGYERKSARVTINPIAIVGKYCLDNGIPQLNTIVVSHSDGEPGSGVILKDGDDVRKAQEDVFTFDWFNIRVPSPGAFRRVWEEWE